MPLKKSGRKKTREETTMMSQIRCIHCGRFLGFEAIIVGIVKIYCKNCKGWTIIDALDIEE